MIVKHEDGSVSGTIEELLKKALQQFQQLTPEEQQKSFEETYNEMGTPMPPASNPQD